MPKVSPPKPEAHLVQLEKKIKEKEEELAFLSSDLPSEIKKLKGELNQKTKQIEDLTSNVLSSSLQSELTKLKAYTEDLKKLEITKDLEINKLNDQLKFKDREIERLNQTIKDNKPMDYVEKEKEQIATHQQETNQLNQKINDLELRIYKLNDDKKQLSLENFKLQEKLMHSNEEKVKQEEEKNNQNDHQELNPSEDSQCVPKETYDSLIEEFELMKKQFEANTIELNSIKTLYNESQTQMSNIKKEFEQTLQKLNAANIENEVIKKELNDLHLSRRERNSTDENHIKDIKYIKAKHEAELNQKEKEYETLKEEKAKTINEYIIKIKELELLNRNLSILLKQVTQGKSDLEEIIIKQEEKVSGLGDKVNKIDQMLKNKNNELKQNESYSLQLINIINDQKKEIANIKSNQKETENNELILMQNQINTLKATIEVKDVAIGQMQQKHKFLQEKYTKLSSEKRMKPQEELLKEAKEMKEIKIKKDKEKGRNRSSNKVKRVQQKNNNNKDYDFNSNISSNNHEENKIVPDAIPPQIIPKSKPKSPFNQQLNGTKLQHPLQQKASNSTLPLILNEKPLLNMNSLNSLTSVEDTKMDEINNMMRKIIDEF